jgi:hypothetical protein
MKTLGSHTGYLEIDHRDSPGLSPADVAHVPNAIPVGSGQVLERDVKQCSHCQRAVVLNPARVRSRAVCLHCFHYICDGCDETYRMTGSCVPFKAVLDRAEAIAEKFVGQPDHPDAVIDPVALAQPGAPSVAVPNIVLTDAT